MAFSANATAASRRMDSRKQVPRHRSSAPATALVLSVACMSGCAAQPTSQRATIQVSEKSLARDALRSQIDEFVNFFQASVESAAMDLERKASTREHRRTAALWRIKAVSQCQEAANQDDPWEALVDVWTVCQRMLDYFETGTGKASFGENQGITVAAARKILTAMEQLALSVAAESFDEVKQRIVAYAADHPIKGGEYAEPPSEKLSDDAEVQGIIAKLVAVPFAPLTALGGIGRTPESVRDVATSVDRFAGVVEDFPASTRWQLQLLALNLEELPTISGAAASLSKISDSTAEFTKTMKEMPREVRKEAEGFLERMDASQPELRTTLGEAQKTVTLIQSASHDVKDVAVEVERTVSNVGESSVALEAAANAVTTTVKEILKFIPASMKDESGQIIGASNARKSNVDSPVEADVREEASASRRGESVAAQAPSEAPAAEPDPTRTGTRFSFQAVTASADTLGSTSEKLRGLVADVRDLIESQTLSAGVGDIDRQYRRAVDTTSARIEGVVDHIAKRSAQLLGLLFGLLLLYQFIRLKTRPTTSPSG